MKETKPTTERPIPTYINYVSTATVERLYTSLLEQIAVKQRYLDPKLSAAGLSRELKTSTRALSAVMLLRFNGNFKTVVNRFRVDRAIAMMKDKHFDHLTCEEIGLSCGFQSRQSFYNAFGSITGQTPAACRQDINTRKNKAQ